MRPTFATVPPANLLRMTSLVGITSFFASISVGPRPRPLPAAEPGPPGPESHCLLLASSPPSRTNRIFSNASKRSHVTFGTTRSLAALAAPVALLSSCAGAPVSCSFAGCGTRRNGRRRVSYALAERNARVQLVGSFAFTSHAPSSLAHQELQHVLQRRAQLKTIQSRVLVQLSSLRVWLTGARGLAAV